MEGLINRVHEAMKDLQWKCKYRAFHLIKQIQCSYFLDFRMKLKAKPFRVFLKNVKQGQIHDILLDGSTSERGFSYFSVVSLL